MLDGIDASTQIHIVPTLHDLISENARSYFEELLLVPHHPLWVNAMLEGGLDGRTQSTYQCPISLSLKPSSVQAALSVEEGNDLG